MKVLQNLWCATLVFVAYLALGYYPLWGYFGAVKAYISERKKLGGAVFNQIRFGLPIGTLMCSVDQGCLPADDLFPLEMRKLREQQFAGRKIGYLGKFAIIPFLQGKCVGRSMLTRMATEWALFHTVDVIVMIVNPDHVKMWSKPHYGAKVVAKRDNMTGLHGAEAVLMYLDFKESSAIRKCQGEYKAELAKNASQTGAQLPGLLTS